jgi:5-hydroxyisourate hydrolase-like protein (transthyretin family)
MGKVIGGGKPAENGYITLARAAADKQQAETQATAINDSGRLMAEELAGKKKARLRGGSRMLLSAERLNAQEGLSAASTLGG